MATSFRPSLTLTEISFILDSVNWADNPDHHTLMRKLEVFTLKAQHGITKPSHIKTGKQTLAASLGMEDDATITTLLEAYNNPVSRSALSPSQLERVQQFRYINDMMTSEEERAHELS